MTQQEAFDKAYAMWGPGSFAGIYDIVPVTNEHWCEVGNRKLAIRFTGKTYADCFNEPSVKPEMFVG